MTAQTLPSVSDGEAKKKTKCSFNKSCIFANSASCLNVSFWARKYCIIASSNCVIVIFPLSKKQDGPVVTLTNVKQKFSLRKQ